MTDAQKLQLERIRFAAQWNNFDGDIIAKDLEDNQHLYNGFVYGRFEYGALIELRDLHEDTINADTIFMLAKPEHIPEIKKLAQKWQVDEFGYSYDNKIHGTGSELLADVFKALGSNRKEFALIRLWWD